MNAVEKLEKEHLKSGLPAFNPGDTVRVRVLPGGRMDSNNAAKYLNRAPKTLAMWRMQGIGPEWSKCGGRVFYSKDVLDAFIHGKVPA